MVTSDNDTVFVIIMLNHGKHEDYDDEIVTVMLTMPFDIYCDSEDLPYDRRRRNIMRNTVFMVNQVSGLLLIMLMLIVLTTIISVILLLKMCMPAMMIYLKVNKDLNSNAGVLRGLF